MPLESAKLKHTYFMGKFYRIASNTLFCVFVFFFSFHVYAQVPNCATALLPANGGTLASPATPFTWNAPTGTVTGYRMYIGTTSAANELVNGAAVTTTSYTTTLFLNCGATYYWKVIPYNGSGPAASCAAQTFTIIAAGNPAVFPIGSWNAYCYNSTNWTNYTGYYTSTGQDFNSNLSWNTNFAPSSASPNGAANYHGCSMSIDNHSVIYKRQGFTPGTYSLDVMNDDGCSLYMNGILIYSRANYTNSYITNVWTGNLDANTQIEFKWTETGGSSDGAVKFNPVPTPILVAGTISSDQILCSGNDPLVFKSIVAGSGTCGPLVYQWQQDVGCSGTWSDIPAATGATYDAPAGITQTTCFRRSIVDPNCNRVDYTNTVTVTVTSVQQGDPSVFPLNTWNGYVHDFSITGYTGGDDNWTDYKGYFSYAGTSASDPGFNSTALYSTSAAPSSAPGYAGCQVSSILSGVQFKRQGFPAGTYQIDFDGDDASYLYINGVLIYGRTACCNLISNVWTGNLDASSKIDYRYKNNGGNGFGRLILTQVTPAPIDGGTVASSASSVICSGDTPPAFTSVSLASGGCSKAGYQWQADTGSGFADISGATNTTYSPVNVVVSSSYRRKYTDICGVSGYSNTVTLTVGTPTLPTPAFGTNNWNAYVYDFSVAGYVGTDNGWTDYRGYFTYNGLSFNTGSIYGTGTAPSYAPGYYGCQTGQSQSGVQLKRQGFPAGTYQIDFNSDDAGYLYINGVLVFGRQGCCTTVSNVWTGNLDASSTIDYHYKNNNSSGYGVLNFSLVTPSLPLDPGVISNNNSSAVCSGNTLPPFVSSTDATSGCYIYYQWELNTGSGWNPISAATAKRYTASNITVSSNYRRKATDACGAVAYSNILSVAIAGISSTTPVFGAGVWNAYVYDFSGSNPTGNGAYTLTNTGWNNNSGTFQTAGISVTNPGFNTATSLYAAADAPSYAPGYQGCQVGTAQNGVIFKRQNFPAATYQIDFTSDDPGYLYVNGTLVSSRPSNGTNTNAWTGVLNNTSTVEFRYKNNGGDGSATVTFTVITTTLPLVPAVIAANQTICEATAPAIFTTSTAAASGCSIFYQWQSSTVSATGPWTSISGATSTTYTSPALTQTTYFSQLVTDGCGGSDVSNAIKITVNPLPLAADAITGSATFCPSQAGVPYSIAAVANATGYIWTLPAGASIATGSGTNSITVNFASASGAITVKATNSCGSGAISSFPVAVIPLPNNAGAFTTSFATVCSGQAGVVYTIAAVTGATGYTWALPSGASISAGTNTNSITVTFGSAAGNVSVTPTNSCGSGTARTLAVAINTVPSAAGIVSGLTDVCRSSGTSTSYSIAAVTGATSYTWSIPSGVTITSGSTLRTLSVTFTTSSVSGNFTVTPVNGCGNGTPSSLPVTVSTFSPSVPGAISGTSAACAGTIGLTYSITAVTGATGYTWTLPSGSTITSGSNTNVITVNLGSSSGNVTVTPKNACGNGLTSLPFIVTVNPYPNTAGAITGTTTVCAGSSQTYSIPAVVNANGYTWVLPAGSTITGGANTRSITATMGTVSGTVSVTPTNGCGNGTGNSVSVTVNTILAAGSISGPAEICKASAGVSYSIPALSGSPTYAWALPAGTVITAGTNTASITVTIGSTSGNVTVTPSNACGAGSSSTLAIIVPVSVPAAAAGITGSAAPCAGQAGLVYSVAAAAGASGYSWVLPAGAFITAGAGTNSITVTMGSASGNITVTPTNACGNGTSSSKLLTLGSAPSAVGSITGATTVCKGQPPVTYSISAVSGATSYSWTVPTGVIVNSGAGTTSIVVSYSGAAVSLGLITVDAVNTCGTKSKSISVTINSYCINTWTGNTSNDWNLASNWSLESVPVSTDDVIVPVSVASGRMPAVVSAVNAHDVISSGTITIASGGTLNTYGNLTNNGTFTTMPGSLVVFKGTSSQGMTGVSTLHNATLNNTSGLSVSSALTLKGTLLLTAGALTTNGNVQVDIDNGGNIGYTSGDAGSVIGNLKVFRAINTNTTHYISCPLDGVAGHDLADDAEVINPTNGNTRLFHYDNAAHSWIADKDMGAVFIPGNAYSMWFPVATTVDFTGSYNHSASYTYSGTNTANKYLFISNPYPSTIDWTAAGWSKSNVKDAIYFWNPNGNQYASYINGVGTNGGSKNIPAMNSFFVAYSATGGSSSTVSMTNSVRVTQSAALWRTASDETVRLTLRSAAATDETVIRFNEHATNGFDDNFDAYKMMNSGSVPSIYTTSGTDRYSVNSIADMYSKDTIPVLIKVPADGEYVLSISSSDPTVWYMLADKKLGTEHRVTTSDYAFTALKADDAARFELQVRSHVTTGVEQASALTSMHILSSPGGFMVRSGLSGSSTVEMLDMTGNRVQVMSGVVLKTGDNFFTPVVSAGVYVVKVTVDNMSYVAQVSIVK